MLCDIQHVIAFESVCWGLRNLWTWEKETHLCRLYKCGRSTHLAILRCYLVRYLTLLLTWDTLGLEKNVESNQLSTEWQISKLFSPATSHGPPQVVEKRRRRSSCSRHTWSSAFTKVKRASVCRVWNSKQRAKCWIKNRAMASSRTGNIALINQVETRFDLRDTSLVGFLNASQYHFENI